MKVDNFRDYLKSDLKYSSPNNDQLKQNFTIATQSVRTVSPFK